MTRVENLEDHLQLDQYLRLGKTSESNINITMNEMYFIQDMMAHHVDVLVKKNREKENKRIRKREIMRNEKELIRKKDL